MLIDNLNLNHLRIFESVYRTRSMTVAADELHLTQSGVSQHMKSLEETLGFKLFDRLNQKLVPTREGTLLFDTCSPMFQKIEVALQDLTGESKKELKGTVSIGMPMEFGHNVILPKLATITRDHPLVKFQLQFGLADEINSLILEGEVDFAFVDAFGFDKRISSEVVFEETLELCVNPVYFKQVQKNTPKFFESLPYVDYQADAALVRMWLDHHFQFKNLTLNMRARVPSVVGVASFVLNGAGAGVLPDHKIQKLEKEGYVLHKIKGSSTPLRNEIGVALLSQRTHSPTALKVRDLLVSLLK